MKILVTGGAGFIGSHVVDAYVAAGHDVIVVDDLSTGRRENLNPRARFHQLDIGDPRTAELVRDEKPEVLNHHAAQMDVRRSVADPLFDARVNILGTIHLLEAARHAGVKRLVFVSSGGAVYGEQETFPAPETHPTNPVSPYGVSKRAGELYAFFFQAEYRLPFVALRYANVYGPRQDPHGEAGVVAIFTGRMLGDEPVVVNGDGRQTRDYLYVGDVARANLLALETRATGPFNIGTGVETDVNALASLLLAAAGSRSQVRHGPPKSGEQRRSVIDCRRAAELLGWGRRSRSPRVSGAPSHGSASAPERVDAQLRAAWRGGVSRGHARRLRGPPRRRRRSGAGRHPLPPGRRLRREMGSRSRVGHGALALEAPGGHGRGHRHRESGRLALARVHDPPARAARTTARRGDRLRGGL